jgi:hypothetical protein
MHKKILSEGLKGRELLEDLQRNRRVILKWIQKEQVAHWNNLA